MECWIILNPNGKIWGTECFGSRAAAEKELAAFIDKPSRPKFEFKRLAWHAVATGDFAGMGWTENLKG